MTDGEEKARNGAWEEDEGLDDDGRLGKQADNWRIISLVPSARQLCNGT
jgi:hypothetical protein